MIEGWTDGRILSHLAALAAGKGMVVEIGSWKGRSGVAIGQATGGLVFCIDTWRGSPQERDTDHKEARDNPLGVLIEFHRNVVAAGLTNVIPMSTLSEIAVGYFPDRSLDLIYVDGDHATVAVSQDLNLWWPKLKPGGVICGDDYAWPSVAVAVDGFARRTGLAVKVLYDNKFWIIEK